MTQFSNLQNAGKYGVILTDPPWDFMTRSAKGANKSASKHYPTMDLNSMIVQDWPVAEMAAPDCWLFVWATWPCLMMAQPLVNSWSDPDSPFTYSSGGAWAKRPRNWRGNPDKWQFGSGYLFRSASEVLLVFRRGKPKWHSKIERNLWIAPIREHSRKPDCVFEMIERATDGPRLEMFSRSSRDGWDSWGNETGKFDAAPTAGVKLGENP